MNTALRNIAYNYHTGLFPKNIEETNHKMSHSRRP
jgi:hypothetical protein